jgi:hypothetical protein
MMTKEKQPPVNLDRRARNDRLYDRLLASGLWVEPIDAREKEGGIEYLRVGAA